MNKLVSLFTIMLLMPCAYSETVPAQLTVEEAVARALENHPAMQGAFLAVEEARGSAQQAGLPPNPELEVGVESWSVSGNRGDGLEFLAGVSQTLPLSGARRTARQAGLAGAEAAGLEAESLRRGIAAEVELLFFKTLAVQQRIIIAGEDFTRQETLAELTRQRFELGDIPEVDHMRASAELARSQAELQEIIRERDTLRAQLAHFCGMAMDAVPECTGEVAPAAEAIPDVASLEEGLRNSPRHQARLLRETQASGEADAVRRAAMPEPGLHVGLRRDTGEGSNAIDAGVRFGLPLFDRNQGARAAARARAQRIRAENEAALREETRRAIGLLNEARSALSTAEQLRGGVLTTQEDTREALEQALRLGGATLFEVLAEYRGISETKRSLLESETRARLALVELSALL
ncbi:MAG TPA: TolC family protein [Candidatus Hydrogenedentes bacterium]|nr:MAG: Cobalt-zinc-cadmium resistance protein CzcC precursor [Candidatus Hydrogenedentes bacterium ADurb.Bin179]HOH28786.1 TolC family protein [Candidatus Hydrogenedentota bacterium]